MCLTVKIKQFIVHLKERLLLLNDAIVRVPLVFVRENELAFLNLHATAIPSCALFHQCRIGSL
jgi:hypothetical protein